MKESTSDLLAGTATSSSSTKTWRSRRLRRRSRTDSSDIPADKKEVYDLLLESIAALIRENKTPSSPPWSKTPCSEEDRRSTSPPTATAASAVSCRMREARADQAAPRQEGRWTYVVEASWSRRRGWDTSSTCAVRPFTQFLGSADHQAAERRANLPPIGRPPDSASMSDPVPAPCPALREVTLRRRASRAGAEQGTMTGATHLYYAGISVLHAGAGVPILHWTPGRVFSVL
jgi:hypothetical protein